MQRLLRLALLSSCAFLLVAQASPEAADEEGDSDAAEETAKKPDPKAKAAPPKEAAPKAHPGADLAYQIQAWEVVNGSAGRINDCLERHLDFQPAAKGSVDLKLDVAGEGKMLKVTTKSSLPSSEKLQQCLKFIAQSWSFPKAEGVVKFSTGLQIQVEKGKKFSLVKPGEKPAAKKDPQASKGDSGFLGFNPTWSPGFTR